MLLPADTSSSGAAAEKLWGHRPPKVAGALGVIASGDTTSRRRLWGTKHW